MVQSGLLQVDHIGEKPLLVEGGGWPLSGSVKNLNWLRHPEASQKSWLGCRGDVAGEQMGNWLLWRSFEKGRTSSKDCWRCRWGGLFALTVKEREWRPLGRFDRSDSPNPRRESVRIK